MSNDFLDAMRGVAPLAQAEHVERKKQPLDAQTAAARRRAAQSDLQSYSSSAPSPDCHLPVGDRTTIEFVAPLDILSFQRPGVQYGVFKKLRLGKYTVQARLDLHQMSVEQAKMAVVQFVSDCLSHDVRCALINHGKGEGRRQPAMLKSCIAHWLPQFGAVLAFHSAQKHQGGVGATYVMLKKSDTERRENLEQHQRRP